MSKTNTQIWLSWRNNSEKLWLPVNPLDELQTSAPADNESVNILNIGEVTIIQKPRLMTWSFSSLFPAQYGPYCNYTNIPRPWDAVNMILRWKNSGEPIRFIVTGTIINYPVTIEEFNFTEKAGDPGTIWYDITLKQYKYVSIKTVNVGGNSNIGGSNKKRPSDKPQPKTYVVKRGDSLWKISKQFYGMGNNWKKIWDANKKTIKDPDKIYPGMKLIIP